MAENDGIVWHRADKIFFQAVGISNFRQAHLIIVKNLLPIVQRVRVYESEVR
jgi:hypothetical protein